MVYNREHYYEQMLVELLSGDATGPEAENKNLHAALRLQILALISATRTRHKEDTMKNNEYDLPLEEINIKAQPMKISEERAWKRSSRVILKLIFNIRSGTQWPNKHITLLHAFMLILLKLRKEHRQLAGDYSSVLFTTQVR
jgi:hypothetical protein